MEFNVAVIVSSPTLVGVYWYMINPFVSSIVSSPLAVLIVTSCPVSKLSSAVSIIVTGIVLFTFVSACAVIVILVPINTIVALDLEY